MIWFRLKGIYDNQTHDVPETAIERLRFDQDGITVHHAGSAGGKLMELWSDESSGWMTPNDKETFKNAMRHLRAQERKV